MLESSIFDLYLQASPIVKAIMLLLFAMSLAVWAVLFAKVFQLAKAKKSSEEFVQRFWESDSLSDLYKNLEIEPEAQKGSSRIFQAGFQEFIKVREQGVKDASYILDSVNRSMKLAFNKDAGHLSKYISFLASVGSSAPYIGLLGTVIGVMHAFQGLGEVANATLSSVAPGIAEALLATGIGLFAAIPAVLAFNYLNGKVDLVLDGYEAFAEEFLIILQRQVNSN